MTADLNEKKQQVPEELVPTVEQLTHVLRAVNDPRTPPQERDGAVRTAQQVASALDVIAAPGTPREVRGQLTGVVKGVTSTLDLANRPGTPPEKQHTFTLLAERSAPALHLIGDRDTPPELRTLTADTVRNLTSAAPRAGSTSAAVAVAVPVISDPSTHDDERKGLAESAHEASSSLDKASDSKASDKERKEARKKLDEQYRRMQKKLKEAVSAHGLPNVPLGKAAEVCTSSIFVAIPDKTLTRDLRSLVPDTWKAEGVKDFWKSQEAGKDALDVFAQLRNDKLYDTPLRIKQIIPQLAHSVPANDLLTALGNPALHCLRAASQLDKDAGITSGNWVHAAQEI